MIGLCPASETSSPSLKQALVFTCLQYMSFANTVGKGEIAHTERFFLFSTVFFFFFFSSPEHKVLRVSYCDSAVSVVRCQRFWLVYALEATFLV